MASEDISDSMIGNLSITQIRIRSIRQGKLVLRCVHVFTHQKWPFSYLLNTASTEVNFWTMSSVKIKIQCQGIIKGKRKVVPVLNEAPRHEDVLGSEGTAPRILDLGTRWR
jgi:hypothetical protein